MTTSFAISPEVAHIASPGNNTDRVKIAQNIDRLYSQHGLSLGEIGQLYRQSKAWVSLHHSILDLSPRHRRLVRTGQLTFKGAAKLANTPKEWRDRVLRESERLGHYPLSAIVATMRRHKLLIHNNLRSMSEINDYLVGMDGVRTPPEVRIILDGLRDWIKGGDLPPHQVIEKCLAK